MAVRNRLTKAAVLEEVNYLRKSMDDYFGMTTDELDAEFAKVFPDHTGRSLECCSRMSREYMIARLLRAATYHMTNVLNLE